ncbi:uncharacterized protein LOC120780003 [Bactrocera tryoni]|uniref:uncharacterized protein LOC120780003 n=1 Tax=Bactrocera tryoni TaxID=59916 RepID=UPI001A966A02|nr:uncharacterized protein LOC120780003 [Bactrocera tryoni]
MRHVDALSRVRCLMLEDSLQRRLRQAQLMDPWVKAVVKVLEKDSYEDFFVKHGVLYKDPIKELIVVPVSMEDEIIKMGHNQGHFSPNRTKDIVERSFYIPQLLAKASNGVVDKLKRQAAVFGNPRRIITDRGAAFTSHLFSEYCESEGIQHLMIATGVPKGNGQVERIHKIVIPMLSKFCVENPAQWYKQLDRVQQAINNTPPRSTKVSPFRLLTGIEMRLSVAPDLKEFLDEEAMVEFDQERESLRKEAQENISKIQQENRRNFNRKRKQEPKYHVNDLVAIKRTQYGVGLKLKPKYEVRKVGDHEGPRQTSTVAEHMKRWERPTELYNSPSFEPNDKSGGPNVGSECRTRSGQQYNADKKTQ